jgi:crossover junction endodeoxyribonuclease RuvC
VPAFDAGQIILGIDPGSLRTGFGLVVNRAGRIDHLSHGTILLDQRKSIPERLADLAADMAVLIDKYRPEHAAVEDVFLFKNPRSALVLGQARGAVLAALGMSKIPIETMSPTRVKSLIAGRGKAKKFQVAELVALELGINPPTSADASDALAIALACARILWVNSANSAMHF